VVPQCFECRSKEVVRLWDLDLGLTAAALLEGEPAADEILASLPPYAKELLDRPAVREPAEYWPLLDKVDDGLSSIPGLAIIGVILWVFGLDPLYVFLLIGVALVFKARQIYRERRKYEERLLEAFKVSAKRVRWRSVYYCPSCDMMSCHQNGLWCPTESLHLILDKELQPDALGRVVEYVRDPGPIRLR
jgi:hypothetical protein